MVLAPPTDVVRFMPRVGKIQIMAAETPVVND
jgi:hypothetical protein